MRLTISGVDRTLRALSTLERGTKKQLREALDEVMAEKFAETQDRVPVKSGKLKASGRYNVRVSSNQLTGRITYGDDEAWYAAKVHEDLEANHPRGGQAKFSESVLNETDLAEEISAHFDLAGALGG